MTCAPDVVTNCVADLAFGLIIGAARGFGRHARTMHEGSWTTRTMGEGLGPKVSGKTLGIVGFGRIGRAVADRARGFGMPVLYHDLARAAPADEKGATFCPDLDAMLPGPSGDWSDYVRGVAAVLDAAGHPTSGANLVILGRVPIGAGLMAQVRQIAQAAAAPWLLD